MTRTMIPNVAPFPVEFSGNGIYETHIDDIHNYLKAWTKGEVTSVIDGRDIVRWFTLMGIPFVEWSIGWDCDWDDYPTFVNWEKSGKDFVPVVYQDVVRKEKGEHA